MCGIAGEWVRHGVASADVVRAQLHTLLHRGPDAVGVHDGGRAAIGQTRLSIIDLELGDPPISSGDGSIGVALNGELYDYLALRAQLQAVGHRFATAGDTEVLAHLAEDLEPVAMARRLDGMFSYAVWDASRRRLVLARDRFGKKPLYWCDTGSHLVFGSEIKALLAHPAVPARPALDVLPSYLTFGYVPTPLTFFEGIRSLRPGHVLILEEDAPPREERYWDVPLVRGPVAPRRLEDAAAEVRRVLREAVRRRLVSDVPVGAFLSGGIDSSAIVALMAELSDRPVRTFTIGFEDGTGFDERPAAALVAQRFRTEHVEFVVRPEAVDLLERLVWHYDQPFGDSSAIPTFLLSELTAKHVTVALAGDGGDEVFAGYERFAGGLLAQRWQRLPALVRRGVGGLPARVPAGAVQGPLGKVGRFVRHADQGLPAGYLGWISSIDPERVARLVPGPNWGVEDYRRHWEASRGAAPLDRLLHLNAVTYLLDDLLPKVDRMAMAHGLEVRAPFLDRELVELAFALPPAHKARGLRLKRVLKEAMRGTLPDAILDRPKHGFGVPLGRWFREDLAPYVAAQLGARDARVRAHLDGPALDTLLEEHRHGLADHGHALWTLLTLEVFLRRHGW